jgi:hypothetical protein
VADLRESLQLILRTDGVRTAALVDAGTGMVVRAAGGADAGLAAAAAEIADEARLAASALGGDGSGGDLEEIQLVTASRFQLLKVLRWRQGDGLLLFVDLDRTRTNGALAVWQISQAASAVLA